MDTKLIKLNTFDSKAIFDTNFNDEIIIEPYSEIAFHSISMKRNNAKLIVDLFNDFITFQTDDASGLIQIPINHDTYSKIHKEDLFKQLNDNGNALLNVTNSKQLGMELKFSIDSSGKFLYQALQLAYGNVCSAQSLASPNLQFVGMSNNANITTRDVGAVTGLLKDNYIYSKIPFIKGAGVARCRLHNLVQPADPAEPNGFGVGITTEVSKLSSNTITFEDLDYAIATGTSPTQTYRIKTPFTNTFTNTVLTPGFHGAGDNRNDIFGIQLTGGNIRLAVHHNNNLNSLLHFELYDTSKTYYVVYFIEGSPTNSSFKQGHFNITPYDHSPNASPHIEEGENPTITDLTAVNPPRTTGANTNYILRFANQSQAEYFGFNNLNHTSDGAVRDFELQADRVFSNTSDSDNYLVELLNIPLNSYDSFINSRMNLLSVIPISERIIDNLTGVIQYANNYPTFISMNNKNRLSLRNIRARVLTADHTQVETDGLSSLNIVIRNKREE